VIRFDVVRVAQDDILEHLECEQGEIDRLPGQFFEPGEVLRLESLGNAARQAQHRVNDLAAKIGYQTPQAPPHRDHLLAHFHTDFLHHTHYVALLLGASARR